MSEPVFFTVEADIRSITQDLSSDSDYSPQIAGATGVVTFRPLIDTGDMLRSINATPRPLGLIPAPTVAVFDTDGRLKLRVAEDEGNLEGIGFAPVRLLANTEYLGLTSDLVYSVTFSSIRTADGQAAQIRSFNFVAPTEDTTVNLIEIARAPGTSASGHLMVAPTGVRMNESGELVFQYDGQDIPNPISLDAAEGPPGPVGATGPQGATGETGAAATIAVGTVTDLAPGSTPTVVNSGDQHDAVLDFGLVTGATGAQGDTGDTGPAATVAVGSVTALDPGSTPTVVNSGDQHDAVLDFGLVTGATGAVGPAGPTGATGATGETGAAATVAVGTVTALDPGSTPTVVNSGDQHDAVLDFGLTTGATGAVGPQGNPGAAASIAIGTVTTVAPSSPATVTNVGTSSSAVLDIEIPKGDTGSASEQTWATLDGKPTVIAAGETQADARTAISAEFTGNRGVALGYASLDAAGKVPVSQLPASLMSFQGVWDASTNTPTLVDGVGDQGDVYRVSVGGTRDLGSGSITFTAGDYVMCNASLVWEHSDTTDAVASVAGKTGVVELTKADVGLGDCDNTADLDKPISTATQTALDGKEPTVNAGTAGQYYRGDKVWASLNKSAVGLGNVDNTTDLDKPVSTATQTALDGKEPTLAAGAEGQYYRGDKSWQTLDKSAVGLGNVDNTSDANKPVSTAVQTALDGKEGTVAAGTTAQYYRGDKSWQTLDKTAVGLGNVDNTADLDKPVSTATQTALDGKEATLEAGTTAQYYRGDKSWQTLDKTAVGLGNVDNTTDLDKPVSTATQTALDGKEGTVSAGTTAQYYRGDKSWQTLDKTAVGLGNVDNTSDATKNAATATLTNKRVTPRIGSTASSATPSIDCDSYDQYNITALAAAVTSVTVTGTPTDGQKLLVRIKDDGTARAIAWGAAFVASGAADLPTTTVATKTHLVGFIYDSTATKWVCVAADADGY